MNDKLHEALSDLVAAIYVDMGKPYHGYLAGEIAAVVNLLEPDNRTAVNSISSSGLRVVTASDMLEVIHQGNVDSPTLQSGESTN